MLSLKIELDLSKFKANLQDKLNRCSDIKPQLEAIGGDMLKDVQLNFRKESTPENEKWTPSQRVLKHGGKTLRKSGALQRSIHQQTDSVSVAVGTNLEYSAVQFYGGDVNFSERGQYARWRKVRGSESRRFAKSGKNKFTNTTRTYRIEIKAYGIKIPSRRYIGITDYKARIYTKSILKYIMSGKVNMPSKG